MNANATNLCTVNGRQFPLLYWSDTKLYFVYLFNFTSSNYPSLVLTRPLLLTWYFPSKPAMSFHCSLRVLFLLLLSQFFLLLLVFIVCTSCLFVCVTHLWITLLYTIFTLKTEGVLVIFFRFFRCVIVEELLCVSFHLLQLFFNLVNYHGHALVYVILRHIHIPLQLLQLLLCSHACLCVLCLP